VAHCFGESVPVLRCLLPMGYARARHPYRTLEPNFNSSQADEKAVSKILRAIILAPRWNIFRRALSPN